MIKTYVCQAKFLLDEISVISFQQKMSILVHATEDSWFFFFLFFWFSSRTIIIMRKKYVCDKWQVRNIWKYIINAFSLVQESTKIHIRGTTCYWNIEKQKFFVRQNFQHHPKFVFCVYNKYTCFWSSFEFVIIVSPSIFQISLLHSSQHTPATGSIVLEFRNEIFSFVQWKWHFFTFAT